MWLNFLVDARQCGNITKLKKQKHWPSKNKTSNENDSKSLCFGVIFGFKKKNIVTVYFIFSKKTSHQKEIAASNG
jgi:hypothetical protein